MLRNFDTDLDVQGVTRVTTVKHEHAQPEVVPAVAATPVVTQAMTPDRNHVFQAEWDWRALRDYVVTQIEERFGPFPRMEGFKEQSIFSSFLDRWGERAVPIARAAFEVHGGYWKQSPISINRFCANSDPYFAAVIAEQVAAAPVTGW